RQPAPGIGALDDIRICTPDLDDAVALFGERAVDDPVLGDDAGQKHLTDCLDDAGAANASHAYALGSFLELGLVGPMIAADHLHLRLERLRIDPDALDRARGRALSA